MSFQIRVYKPINCKQISFKSKSVSTPNQLLIIKDHAAKVHGVTKVQPAQLLPENPPAKPGWKDNFENGVS